MSIHRQLHRLRGLIIVALFIGWLCYHALTVQSSPALRATVRSNTQTTATPLTTTAPAQVFLPLAAGQPPAQLVIAAAHIDSVISGEGDEAVLLWNIGRASQTLAGWQLATLTGCVRKKWRD